MRIIFIMLVILQITARIPGQDAFISGPNQKTVHYDDNLGLTLVESIQPGTTLYGLSRKYHIPEETILRANPDLDPSIIPIGHPVNIPLSPASILFNSPAADKEWIWLSYRVRPKETLFRISKIYLNSHPDIITGLNPSAKEGLRIGQVLHVGWLVPGIEPEISSTDSTILLPTDYISDAKLKGQVVHEQKGLAVWKPGSASSHYYVLHPTARLGSYMEITNPMLQRTITAKVAGHLPPGLYQSNVGIVVSPSIATALGVLDQHFFARWRFIE